MRKLKPYNKEWLEELVSNSFSYREVLKKAGRATSGGESYKLLKNKIKEYGINTKRFYHRSSMYNGGGKEKYSCDEILIKNSPVTQKVLRDYVKRHNKLIYECAICGFDGDTWEGEIALELDHINGDNTDNRICNLRYLCPNCHATTLTYRGKNKRIKLAGVAK